MAKYFLALLSRPTRIFTIRMLFLEYHIIWVYFGSTSQSLMVRHADLFPPRRSGARIKCQLQYCHLGLSEFRYRDHTEPISGEMSADTSFANTEVRCGCCFGKRSDAYSIRTWTPYIPALGSDLKRWSTLGLLSRLGMIVELFKIESGAPCRAYSSYRRNY
jgi:hypothetical protein